ncbi:MAG: hypothetical protein ACRDL6_01085 [Solirubrobacterales bacterium]
MIETKELLQTVVASLIGGIGITASFSLVIFGTVRVAALARDERSVLTLLAGALTAVALAVTIGGIALGLFVMTSK